VNLKEIRDLIKVMERCGVAEMEVEQAGFRLWIELSQCPPMQPVSPTGAAIAPRQKKTLPPHSQVEEPRIIVHSPLPGVFYRGPAPDADPFIMVSQQVRKGQTLCKWHRAEKFFHP